MRCTRSRSWACSCDSCESWPASRWSTGTTSSTTCRTPVCPLRARRMATRFRSTERWVHHCLQDPSLIAGHVAGSAVSAVSSTTCRTPVCPLRVRRMATKFRSTERWVCHYLQDPDLIAGYVAGPAVSTVSSTTCRTHVSGSGELPQVSGIQRGESITTCRTSAFPPKVRKMATRSRSTERWVRHYLQDPSLSTEKRRRRNR